MFQEPQIKRPEHQDDPNVHHQPLPEPVPEEQDVHADHDGYQRKHVEHDDDCLSSHPFFYHVEPERREFRLSVKVWGRDHLVPDAMHVAGQSLVARVSSSERKDPSHPISDDRGQVQRHTT